AVCASLPACRTIWQPDRGGKGAPTRHRDPAVYASLADLVDQIERAFGHGEVAAVLDGDRRFHATLVAATGSPRLRRFYGQLQQEQRLALALSERSRRELGRTADDHRQLLDALHGSREQARAQLTAHLQAGAAELQRLLGLLAQRKQLAHREEGEIPRG